MEYLDSAAVRSNQPEIEAADTSQIWTPDSRELVEHGIAYPTTYSAAQEEGSHAKRTALRAQIVHGLPENVAELGDRVAEIEAGKRYSEHQTNFSSIRLASLNGLATDVPDSERFTSEQTLRLVLRDDELVDRLYDGTATIPDHLVTYQNTGALGAEIARAVMPLGHNHQHLPAFYKSVREGVLAFDPNAKLHPPVLQKLEPMDITGHFDEKTGEIIIDSIAYRAQLDHGTLSEGSAIRAHETFLLSLRPDAAMASNNDVYQEMTRNVTEQVLSAHRNRKSWQSELAENPDALMAIMVEDYFQDEYQKRPAGEVPSIDWIRRLESTLYVTNSERQAAYEQRLAEEIAYAEQQEKPEYVQDLALLDQTGAKEDIVYNGAPYREVFAEHARLVGFAALSPARVMSVDDIIAFYTRRSYRYALKTDVDTKGGEEADEGSHHEHGVLDLAVDSEVLVAGEDHA
jgi:hypothetical protein